MKVLIISSSPRKGGNSDVLCDPFAKGAVEAGHEVENLKKTFGLGCMRPPMKNGEGESRMAKLVVFYSRADENYFGGQYRFVTVGNTEKAAHMIADATGAELFKIEQKEPYAPDYKHCIDQAMADKRANARPELVELPENLDGYDEIYLGYPNYWGDLPMAVYTFLEAFDWTGKTIHPFCTHEGSGLSGTEGNIARTCKGADVKAGLAICGSDADHSKDLVLRWLNQ